MYRWLRPLLFSLDAERAHNLALGVGGLVQRLPSRPRNDHPSLGQDLFGCHFPNPVGIAAGLDKNARCVLYWDRIGCGYVEIGSVSADPAPGNPKPRAFRLPKDRALINRMGLNNAGAEEIAGRIAADQSSRRIPLGINIVKTHRNGLEGEAAVGDFCRSFRILAPLADYVALNISCPNTDDGKTFETPDVLEELLESVFAERERLGISVPVLVKLSPPAPGLSDLDVQFGDLIKVTASHPVDGYIATNTASDRAGLVTDRKVIDTIGNGGLSGRPLAERARVMLRYLYEATGGEKPIISVGGIDTIDEAVDRIYHGASLIQVYTGLVYEGPGLVRRLNQGLARRLSADGYSDIKSAVGKLA